MSEHRFSVFQGRLFADIAPLLDGHHTIPELLGRVGGAYPLNEFFSAIGQLAREGLITDGPPPEHGAAFFDHLDAGARVAAAPLEVEVVALGAAVGAGAEKLLTESLEKSGVRVTSGAGLRVVVVDDYLAPELEAFNAVQHEAVRPWLLTKPSGVIFWVGPLVRPGKSACWKCLEQRLRANREVERYVERFGREITPHGVSRATLPSVARTGVSLAALEIVKALATDGAPSSVVVGAQSSLEDRIITFDVVEGGYQEHKVLRRPQCKVCGPTPVLEQRPIVLESRPKLHAALSGHRSALPEETFAKYEHHISPITGVVTMLTPREDESGLVNNYTAGHYFPVFEESSEEVQINRFARSGAGGRTPASAKTSTLCEALERYSGIFWGEEHRIKASYRALGEQAVHMRDLALFSETQLARRQATNPKALRNQQVVPDPLDEDAEISWTPAWSLTHQRFRYLPTSYCFYGFKEPSFQCLADSNGNAAGNTLEEAILSGFLELVERDAVAMWWYNRVNRPAVDAETFGIPYWKETLGYYERTLDREIHVLDLMVDTQIPVFAVISRRKGWPVEDITLGFAAHLDPTVALLRALGGMNQYLPSLTKRGKDGHTMYRFIDPETLAWWKSATYAKEPYLLPDTSAAARAARDFPSQATPDVKTDLEKCLDVARRLGLEVLVVDQTRPDIGLPVAKVVVPGLRHFWRRLAPGRLYDVPVALGWLDKPRLEEEMNPIACFV